MKRDLEMQEKYSCDSNYVVQRRIVDLNEVIPLGFSAESVIASLVNESYELKDWYDHLDSKKVKNADK